MELLNEMYKARQQGALGHPSLGGSNRYLPACLAPVAPHISEELWQRTGRAYSVHVQSWPEVDEAATREEEITLVVQVNGKLRERSPYRWISAKRKPKACPGK